jgi:hypothetical protein
MSVVTDKEYYIDGFMLRSLENVAFNISEDWDAVILVSGDGMVRVGKSVLAMQIGYYLAWRLGTPFNLDNVVFSGEDLMKTALAAPKHSVFVYDEARESLNTGDVAKELTKRLVQFLNECGQLNHILVMVLPDFFDLPKFVAISRSIFLANVYASREEVKNPRPIAGVEEVTRYKRGFVQYFNRDAKRKLYMLGKKAFHDYSIVKPTAVCRFTHKYVVDEEAYREKKKQQLAEERTKERDTKHAELWKRRTAIAWRIFSKDFGLTHEDMRKFYRKHGEDIDLTRFSQIIKGFELK